MHVTKVRFWVLAFLLLIYLAGVLILSALTLQDPRNGINVKSVGNPPHRNYEYEVPGFRGSRSRRYNIQWCTELKFLNPPRSMVALVSFPGSGNTWLRYLLQQATGIYTGSVYKDIGLLKNGFPAENVVNGSVLLVKTHEWGADARKPFSKAILLIRSPAAAIQAEFNRQSGGHIGFAAPERYKKNKGKFWRQFVRDKLKAWKQTNLDWLYNFTGPTHVIFYEQLVDDVENIIKSIIQFLEVPINEKSFKCAMERKEGIYRRWKKVKNFDPFTHDMKVTIQREQRKVYEAIYSFATPSADSR